MLPIFCASGRGVLLLIIVRRSEFKLYSSSTFMENDDLKLFVESIEEWGVSPARIPFQLQLPLLACFLVVVYWFCVWLTGYPLEPLLLGIGGCLGMAARKWAPSNLKSGYFAGLLALASGYIGLACAFPFALANQTQSSFLETIFFMHYGSMILYFGNQLGILPLAVLLASALLAYFLGKPSKSSKTEDGDTEVAPVLDKKVVFPFPSTYMRYATSIVGGLILLACLAPLVENLPQPYPLLIGSAISFSTLPLVYALFLPRLLVQNTGLTFYQGFRKLNELPLDRWQRIQIVTETRKTQYDGALGISRTRASTKYQILVYGDGLAIPFPKTESQTNLYRFLRLCSNHFAGEALPTDPKYQGLLVEDKVNRALWMDWNLKSRNQAHALTPSPQ
jgi:hypothetical protein